MSDVLVIHPDGSGIMVIVTIKILTKKTQLLILLVFQHCAIKIHTKRSISRVVSSLIKYENVVCCRKRQFIFNQNLIKGSFQLNRHYKKYLFINLQSIKS